MLLAKTQELKPRHFSFSLSSLSFCRSLKKTAASPTQRGRRGAIHKAIERSKRRKRKKRTSFFARSLLPLHVCVCVCCCQQQQQSRNRRKTKRRREEKEGEEGEEEEEEEEKSYFIKNGIEPLSPSCHASVSDLYKLTGRTPIVVLRKNVYLLTSLRRKKRRRRTRTHRKTGEREKTLRTILLFYTFYLRMFPSFFYSSLSIDIYIRFSLSLSVLSMSKIIAQTTYVSACVRASS
ncbi:MAG: hypothetical protein JNN26_26920, partial [Candidatus Obscuribacter sp.]|nr:hypothetical protein [Candidatus Obscuribacter sp.]